MLDTANLPQGDKIVSTTIDNSVMIPNLELLVVMKKEVDEVEEVIVSRQDYRPDNANTTKDFDRQDKASTTIKEESQELKNIDMFDLMEHLSRHQVVM